MGEWCGGGGEVWSGVPGPARKAGRQWCRLTGVGRNGGGRAKESSSGARPRDAGRAPIARELVESRQARARSASQGVAIHDNGPTDARTSSRRPRPGPEPGSHHPRAGPCALIHPPRAPRSRLPEPPGESTTARGFFFGHSSWGMAAVRFSGPAAVMRMLSSIRTPPIPAASRRSTRGQLTRSLCLSRLLWSWSSGAMK